MEKGSLLSYLEKLTDKRRAEGKRHPIELILIIVIMSTMSRYYGYRGIERFIKKNRSALMECLNPGKNMLPSLATIRRVLMGVDFNEFSELFKQWALGQTNIPKDTWISLDGKCLRNTVTDYDNSFQNFVSIVSAYCQASGLVISIDNYHSKKISEIAVVREMIEDLGIEGVIFTMDALHIKKNSGNDYSDRQ